MTGNRENIISEWSICLIAGTSLKAKPEDIASDGRIKIDDPRVGRELSNCRKGPRIDKKYINGGCEDCPFKQRLNLKWW